MKNNFCLFERSFKIQKNGVFVFEISFFVLEILTFFYCDAKFKEHHLNIPKDVLYPVFYHFSCKPHDVINPNLHNTKTSISLKRKMIFQKQKRHSSVF